MIEGGVLSIPPMLIFLGWYARTAAFVGRQPASSLPNARPSRDGDGRHHPHRQCGGLSAADAINGSWLMAVASVWMLGRGGAQKRPVSLGRTGLAAKRVRLTRLGPFAGPRRCSVRQQWYFVNSLHFIVIGIAVLIASCAGVPPVAPGPHLRSRPAASCRRRRVRPPVERAALSNRTVRPPGGEGVWRSRAQHDSPGRCERADLPSAGRNDRSDGKTPE